MLLPYLSEKLLISLVLSGMMITLYKLMIEVKKDC